MNALGLGLGLGLGLRLGPWLRLGLESWAWYVDLELRQPKTAKTQYEMDTWHMKMLKHKAKLTVLESRIGGCNFFCAKMRLLASAWASPWA